MNDKDKLAKATVWLIIATALLVWVAAVWAKL